VTLAKRIRGFYGICDLVPEAGPTEAALIAGMLLDGGAPVLQLRMKRASGARMLACAEALRSLCAARGAVFVVNDRMDIALACGADGVHLGQEDLPLQAARRIAPPGFLIGVSTHTEEQVDAALAGGADYLGFGPCFPTTTKDNPDPVVGLLRLAEAVGRAHERRVPLVAIGGITLARLPDVVAAGADAAAVISAVLTAPDVRAAARAVADAFR
jgi:thiamine-phosphate pyrophosphorylase